MKLIPKRGGNGYVSSYTLNISLNLARQNNLLNDDGTTKEVELRACKDGILITPMQDLAEYQECMAMVEKPESYLL